MCKDRANPATVGVNVTWQGGAYGGGEGFQGHARRRGQGAGVAGEGLDDDRRGPSGEFKPAIPDRGFARFEVERGEPASRGFPGVADYEDLVAVSDQLGADQGGGDITVAGEASGQGQKSVPARRAITAAGAGHGRTEDMPFGVVPQRFPA